MSKKIVHKLGSLGFQIALSLSSLSAVGAANAYYRVRNYKAANKSFELNDPTLNAINRKNLKHTKVLEAVDRMTSNEVMMLKSTKIKELLIIDAAIKDKAIFHRFNGPLTEVVELSGSGGISELIGVLGHYENLDALHIVSHANAGELQLNGLNIDQKGMEDWGLYDHLNKSVSANGDVLFYGCELGKGAKGEAFLRTIQGNTNLDIAASNDKTGNIELGGDWDLELTMGNIEAKPLAESIAMKDFTEILQFTGTIQFDQIKNSGDYTGNATNDASFYTSSLKENTLVADGTTGGTGSYYSIAAIEDGVLSYNGETKIRLSFSVGETFDVNGTSSIYVFNYSAGARTFTFTSDNGVMATSSSIGASSGAYVNLNANNTNITYVDITANASFYTHFSLFKVSGVAPASSPVSSSITAQTDNVCNGDALGSLTVTATDGTTPYTYAWSNSATTASISALTAGTYTVTVTDAGGTTTTSSATITEPTALNTSISSQTNVACFGESTGSLTASVTGGTSPYTYHWNSGESSATISGKAAGTYTVSVQDANGCGEGPPP